MAKEEQKAADRRSMRLFVADEPRPAEAASPTAPLVPKEMERSRSSFSNQSKVQKLRDELIEHSSQELSMQVSPAFTKIMACVVILNAVRFGLQSQWSVTDNPQLGPVFFFADVIFAVVFSAEMVIKLAVFRIQYFSSGWNYLDMSITAAAVVDLWEQTHPDGGRLKGTKIMCTLRFLRVIRLIRVLKGVDELVMVVEGIAKAMKSVFWVVLLLLTVTYMFGVFVTMELGNDEAMIELYGDINYFGDLQHSMLTLLDIALLAEWPEVIRPIMKQRPILLPMFLAFMMVSTFGVMNILIGVIVDSTTEARSEMHMVSRRRDLIRASSLWEECLHDKQLSHADLKQFEGTEMWAVRMAERKAAIKGVVQQILDSKYIDFPQGLVPEDVISLLDFDGSMELNHEEFLSGLSRLLLGNEFQLTCLTMIMMGKMRNENKQLQQASEERLEERLERIETAIQEQSRAAATRGDEDARFQRGVEERLRGIEGAIGKLADARTSRARSASGAPKG